MSIIEYARKCGISYEAARKQISRYQDQLGAHVLKNGRKLLIDDWAVDFLDQKRQGNPVVIAHDDLKNELEALRAENKGLVIKLAEQATQLAGAYKQLAEAQQQALQLPAAQQQLQAAQLEARAAQQQLQEAQQEADRLRAELDAERRKGWLQRLFGR